MGFVSLAEDVIDRQEDNQRGMSVTPTTTVALLRESPNLPITLTFHVDPGQKANPRVSKIHKSTCRLVERSRHAPKWADPYLTIGTAIDYALATPYPVVFCSGCEPL